MSKLVWRFVLQGVLSRNGLREAEATFYTHLYPKAWSKHTFPTILDYKIIILNFPGRNVTFEMENGPPQRKVDAKWILAPKTYGN